MGECLRSGQIAAYIIAQFGRKINKRVVYGVISRYATFSVFNLQCTQ